MVLENREQVEKAIAVIKDYEVALKRLSEMQGVVRDKLNAVRNATGITGNDSIKMMEEADALIGQAYRRGVMDQV